MGDRANVHIVESLGDTGVYLYTHWRGFNLAKDVQRALAKRWRWNDAPYLTRIVFDVMTECAHGDETGYGIDSVIGDNEHPVITLDVGAQEVFLANEDGSEITGTRISFELFVAKDGISQWWLSQQRQWIIRLPESRTYVFQYEGRIRS